MEQFVEKFGIDWKLMIAQLINFAIIFVIFKAFVYKPILRLLDERKKKIEDGLSFADKAKAELENIEVLKSDEVKKAQQEGLSIVKAAEQSALKTRDEIVAGGEAEKQKLLATGKALLSEQKSRMEKGVYDQAVALVEVALGKVLGKTEFAKEERTLITETLNQISIK